MALIIDYACPFDFQVKWKTTRKKKMRTTKTWRGSWNGSKNCAKVTVVPVIIGALGTVPTERFIIKCLAEISVKSRLESLQRACLLVTDRILHKVLDILCHGHWHNGNSDICAMAHAQAIYLKKHTLYGTVYKHFLKYFGRRKTFFAHR